jgi:hypothetical protein
VPGLISAKRYPSLAAQVTGPAKPALVDADAGQSDELATILLSPAVAFAQASEKTAAPHALQTEFERFITKFRAALKANDSAAVAGMTRLPFMEDTTYSDAAKFRAKAYPEFFTKKNRACIRREKAVYDRDEENNDNYHISCYENIFTFTRRPAGFLFTDVSVND